MLACLAAIMVERSDGEKGTRTFFKEEEEKEREEGEERKEGEKGKERWQEEKEVACHSAKHLTSINYYTHFHL
jgi:hypothetical protein